MKVVALLATALLAAGGLSACSSNNAYCDALRANEDAISSTETNNETLKKIKAVQNEAPSAVKDDWSTVAGFLEKVMAAEKDPVIAKTLGAEESKVTAAVDTIKKHAKDECNIELQ